MLSSCMDDEALKRQFSRVPLSHTVRFRMEGAAGFETGIIGNISLGGMFVKTNVVPPTGAQLYLQFLTESGDIVAEGYGRVAHLHHAGEQGVGVEFTKIDEKFIAYAQLVVSEELMKQRLRP